ncbi:hypothetical protein SUNI508_11947 [Seiridium unicorne]|uniref:Lectin n=1 Tax=Seiridium unicorne TaxID=138068 RepID=A0ABR2UFP1_9PEZI
MAAFFAWSNVANSFVVANGSLLHYQNMPPDYEGRFKVTDWNAMQLNAFYTGPNGYHWALKHNQEYGLVRMGRGHATSLAFGPGGTCWFVRYNTNQCIWGPDISAFPSTWKSLIGNLERSHPRKDECIEFVAFGQYEILLVRFENGNSHMALPDDPAVRSQISSGLIQEVEERLAGGWTLGNRTALVGGYWT